MLFEAMLARLLNTRRQKPARVSGLHLGYASTLIGNQAGAFSIRPKPVQHSFVCGRTGSGKTTLLLRLIAEHLRARLPFLFIDFHGPATDAILSMVSAMSAAAAPVILLEPWADPVVGWNPLETGESPYGIVQELISVFHRRLWPDAWGPRLEELLRMTLLALTEAKLTLLEATTFLSRPDFRRAVLRQVTVPEVREFWTLRFERLSPSQRSLVTEAVLNKLSVFHDPALKYVIGQTHGSLELDKAFGRGQTIIANLSAGMLRGNNYLLAALLVAKLKSAVYRRPAHAKPYSIILDEFQEMFALDALDDYLRSFRKFQCSVFLATQHLQLTPELKAAIFANCSRFFAFATSAADANFLAKEFGSPEANLVAEILPELPTGQAMVKVRGEPARLLKVLVPPENATAERVAAGRARCLSPGAPRREVDKHIRDRVQRFSGTPVDSERRERAPEADATGTGGLPEGYEGF